MKFRRKSVTFEGWLHYAADLNFILAEYVVTEPEFKRLKCRFHLQTSDNQMIVRWDNAPHHPEVKTHPDHIHIGQKIKASQPMDIPQALEAVLSFIE